MWPADDGVKQFYALVNKDNPGLAIPVTPTNTFVRSVTAVEPTAENQRNTKVVLGTYPNKGYTEDVTLFYDRLDLAAIMAPMTDQPAGSETTVHELIPRLVKLFSYSFTTDDFLNTPIDQTVFPYIATITAAPNSLLVRGSFTMHLVVAGVQSIDITWSAISNFTNTTMAELITPRIDPAAETVFVNLTITGTGYSVATTHALRFEKFVSSVKKMVFKITNKATLYGAGGRGGDGGRKGSAGQNGGSAMVVTADVTVSIDNQGTICGGGGGGGGGYGSEAGGGGGGAPYGSGGSGIYSSGNGTSASFDSGGSGRGNPSGGWGGAPGYSGGKGSSYDGFAGGFAGTAVVGQVTWINKGTVKP